MSLEEVRSKFIEGDVLGRDYKGGPLELAMRMGQILSSRYEGSNLPVRLSMGLFYTPEEWEEVRNRVLLTPMPGSSLRERASYGFRRFRWNLKRYIGRYISK